jgi:hypothetical protein
VILDRAELDKGEPITCLGNSCTSPLPEFRVHEVQVGQGETARISGGKAKHLMQAIDHKTWETLERRTECGGGWCAGRGGNGGGSVRGRRGRFDPRAALAGGAEAEAACLGWAGAQRTQKSSPPVQRHRRRSSQRWPPARALPGRPTRSTLRLAWMYAARLVGAAEERKPIAALARPPR